MVLKRLQLRGCRRSGPRWRGNRRGNLALRTPPALAALALHPCHATHTHAWVRTVYLRDFAGKQYSARFCEILPAVVVVAVDPAARTWALLEPTGVQVPCSPQSISAGHLQGFGGSWQRIPPCV